MALLAEPERGELRLEPFQEVSEVFWTVVEEHPSMAARITGRLARPAAERMSSAKTSIRA